MIRKSKGLSVSTAIIVVAVIAGFLLRQDVYDWWRLRGYTPSSEIVALADKTTLNEDSRRLFYVQHPLLADKAAFNDFCRDNEYTIVLGCYIHRQGIFLLDVTDDRLSGVEEVTAAHELLHAAYERLSSEEKFRINNLLIIEFERLNDKRINETIEQYRKQNPDIVPNELHSIIGTEVRSISPELEEYYSRYFNNRQEIVSYSERYEQAFIERRNQIRVYDEQLSSLNKEIEALQASLSAQNQALISQRNQMNSLKSSGNTQEYNKQVPIYNAKVQKYNQDISTLESKINQYNEIVQKRNAIAEEEAELVEAIDSRTAIPQQQ